MRLYRDAHGVIVGTQAEAKRMGKGWEQIDVPVDKQGLIDYLNAPTAAYRAEVRAATIVDEPTVERIDCSTHKTQAEVDAMFEPSAGGPLPSVDKVCEAISQSSGVELGHIAMEVAARFKALA